MKQLISVLLCATLATPLVAQDADDLTPSGTPAPLRSVKLIEAGGAASQVQRVFFGQIAALETVDLSFEVGGRMVMFDAQEGQFLQEGVQIAALDPVPFERAVQRAEVQLTQAERDFERSQTLAKSNAVSTAQAQDTETARDLARIALSEAREALDHATLIAPFRALVASRLTPNYANVSPGQAIVRLHDMSEVRVEIDVPEQMFQMYSNTADVEFTGTSPLFAGGVPLELREFNAETQSIGQSYRVTLALPSDQVTPKLIPGASMSVTARIAAGDDTATTLPPSAVVMADDQARVMVYTPDETGEQGQVSWVNVDVSSNTGTDIITTGLEPGTLVVGAGTQLLREGDTVRPFNGLSIE
ncbi:MAG: RND family efflux transporter MFP subunit [Sulfitobacter pontiacus]|jgi:RND family efflux transporter MFP subunit